MITVFVDELPECSADQTSPIYFPDYTDVTKFYICFYGNIYLISCPSGLNFNPILEICDLPAQAQLPECPADQTSVTYLPDVTDVTKFYRCQNGELIQFECPSGLIFNPTLEVCDWPAQSVLPECPADQKTPIHLPDVTDATKFYRCQNGELIQFECPSDLIFNPTLEVCDWPAKAELPECPADQTTPIHLPDVTDVTRFFRCQNGELRLFDCPSDLIFNPTLEVCDWPAKVELPQCPADQTTSIFFPDVTDVTKFYRCLYGDLIRFDCSTGLIFNPALNACYYPA